MQNRSSHSDFVGEFKIAAFIIAGIVILPTFLIWIITSLFTDYFLAKIPTTYDVKFGQSVQENTKPRIFKDPNLNARLAHLTQVIIAANPQLKFKFKFSVVDHPMVNAFAAPGGFIFITRPLIERAQSAEEILGIIGHEIGHVENRHSARSLLKQTLYLIPGIFFSAGGMNNIVGQLTYLKFSRYDEMEADALGFSYLYQAKVSPVGMIDFFKRAKTFPQAAHADELLLTHPLPQDRIDNLTRLAANNLKYVGDKMNFDFKTFRELALQAKINQPGQN